MKIIDQWRADDEVFRLTTEDDGTHRLECRPVTSGGGAWRDVTGDSEALLVRIEELASAIEILVKTARYGLLPLPSRLDYPDLLEPGIEGAP